MGGGTGNSQGGMASSVPSGPSGAGGVDGSLRATDGAVGLGGFVTPEGWAIAGPNSSSLTAEMRARSARACVRATHKISPKLAKIRCGALAYRQPDDRSDSA